MPDVRRDSLHLTREIKKAWPDMPILAITIHRDDMRFLDMLKAGASGYIMKDAEPQDLVDAIQVVSEKKVWLSPTMTQVLVEQFRTHSNNGNGWGGENVTTREKEILRMMADGLTVNQMAARLFITPSTVHTHRSNIMSKLGLHDQHELIQHAKKHGLTNNNH